MADLTITAANVVKSDGAETTAGTAGETITPGQSVYRHTDEKLYKAMADTAAHAACVGIALNGAYVNQPLTYIKSGRVNIGAGQTPPPGVFYAVTDTAGGISNIADRGTDDYITVIGYSVGGNVLQIHIVQTGQKML